MCVGLLTPITNTSARSVISAKNVTNSMLCALEMNANIITRRRKTSLRQTNGNLIAVRSECVLDTRYPYHEKLHGGTDLVHSVLCEGIEFIASQSIFGAVRFDGQCQVMDNNPRNHAVHIE